MKINSTELLLLNKKIKFAGEEGKSAPEVAVPAPEANSPQTGMNLLMFQGLNNVVSEPQLSGELKIMREDSPKASNEGTTENSAKEYVAPYQTNLAFQGKASKFKSIALAALMGLATIGATSALTSCDDKEYIGIPGSSEVNVTVNVDLSAITSLFQQMQAMWQQMLEQQQITNEQLQQNNEFIKQLLEMYKQGMTDANAFYEQMYNFMMSSSSNQQVIIDLLTQNGMKQDEANKYLQEIMQEVKDGNLTAAEAWEKIVELLGDINTKLDGVFEKINEIYENNLELKEKVQISLDRIEQLVKENNANVVITNNLLNQLIVKFENGSISEEDLQKLLDAISKNGDKIDITNELLLEMQNQDKDLQKEILEYIASVGLDMNNNFKNLINSIENNKVDLAEVMELLKSLNDKVDQNTEANKTNTEAILNCLNAIGFEMVSQMNNILEEIGNNSYTLSEVARLLAKIQNENADFQKNIVNAIDKLGVNISNDLTKIVNAIENGNDTASKNIEALLDKVLAKLDKMDSDQQASAKAIIDAISNISIEGGGSIDISSLEKMMSELLQLTAKNNGLLESIDGKMDVIQLSIDAAKEEIIKLLGDEFDKNDERYKNIINTLNGIKVEGGSGSYDDTELLKKLDSILVILDKIGNKNYDDTELMEKLDKILEAIKDHNITVDITGKVTCDCNCGGNHEGILGDIEDVLG